MKDKKYFQKLYSKYTDNSISREELKILIAHLKKTKNDEELLPLQEMLERKSRAESRKFDSGYKESFLDKVIVKVNEGEKDTFPPLVVKKTGYKWYKVAAVFILVAVSSIFVYFLKDYSPEMVLRSYETSGRQKSTITLSDGSTIQLNSKSKLVYPEKFEGNVREVTLEGEAFFDVAHNDNMPFLVKSGAVITRVLGTSFNVRAYPEDNEIKVAVATGKVSVIKNSRDEKVWDPLFLTPNEVANYDPSSGRLVKEAHDISELIAWKDGMLLFNDKNFFEVAKILERWYDIKVIIGNPKLKSCSFRGKFKNPSLQKVLDALKFAYKIDYELTDDGVVINGKGCE